MPDPVKLEISWVSLWRVLIFVILGMAFFSSIQIFLALFLSVVISSGLEFLVTFLESRGMPRTLGAILVFLAIIFLVIAILYFILPLVVLDANDIFSKIDKNASSYWLGPLVNFKGSNSISLFLNRLTGQLFSGDFSPLQTFSDVLGGVGLTIAVIFSSFYLSVSRDGVEKFLKTIIPSRYESQSLRIYHRARHKVGFWFRTQIVLSFFMCLLVWGALSVLGVRHPFFLAVLAGVFELVPFVGPILSGAAAVLSALAVSSVLAFYTLLIFIFIQQFESHVLVPVLTRRIVGLHPVVVIIAILIGLELEGLLGALVAVPLAAVIQEIISDWSSRKIPIPASAE